MERTTIVALFVIGFILAAGAAFARGHENSPLHSWFENLANKQGGMCCSYADGFSIRDVDWDTQAGHYRVRIKGIWYFVPDKALVSVPNRLGPAVVWPYVEDGVTKIRCFMPGAMG